MRIAILGAGVAGACLASQLKQKHTLEVFEKSRGPGGRMSTRRTDDWKVDHGAQFFTIRDDRFVNFAAPLIHSGVIRHWRPRLAVFRNETWTLDEWKDEHYVAAPSMNSLSKHLLEGVEVHYGTQIDSISGYNGHWELNTNKGDFGFFDLVISTMPAPQATKILPKECVFVEELSKVQMQPCLAFFVRLKEDIDLGWDAAIVKENAVSWMAMNHSKPGRSQHVPVFVMHLESSFSATNFDRDMKSWCIETMASLCKIHPSQVHELYAHRWRYAKTSVPANQFSYFDEHLGLAVAGDWCPGERVEGAVVSALDLLDKI